jgi:transcription elongation factor Elf1
MSNKLVCPKCGGKKYYYIFNYDTRKRIMLNCDYCKAEGEVEINEETIKDLTDDAGQLQ